MPPPPPPTPHIARTSLYVAVVILAAIAFASWSLVAEGIDDWGLLVGLAVTAIVLEFRPIHINLLATTGVSFTTVAIFATALLLGAGPAALVAAAAVLSAQTTLGRPWYKVLFNAAVFAILGMTAAATFDALAGDLEPARALHEVGPAVVAALAAFVVNTLLVAGVVSLSSSVPFATFWRQSYGWLTPHDLTLYVVGYGLALAYSSVGLVGVATFTLPVITMWLVLYQYTTRARGDLDRIRAAESALRVSEQQYRSLVETTTRGIFVAGANGDILFHNGQFASLIGAAGRLQGRRLDSFVAPDDHAILQAAFAAVPHGVRRLEIHHPRQDNDSRLLALTLSRYGDDGDQILGEVEDITARHAMEQRVQHAQRLDSVGNLAAGISHDFNNLLTVVMANLEATLDAADTPPEPVRAAIDATRSASELSQQLLAFGRARPQQRAPVAVAHVVSQVATLLERTIDPHIAVATDVPEDLAVLADLGQLKQVILNLAINGCDAMDGAGRLTICARRMRPQERPGDLPARDDGYAVLEVTDTGSGMDAETAARVFEPFFTTKQGTGTGLGCAVVYGIIREHRGLVAVDTAPGRGTTMRIFLPACDAADAPAPIPLRPRNSPAADPDATVLVIDDLQPVRKAATMVLRSTGYHTLEAADGEDGLDAIAQHDGHIDAVLLDLTLPGLTGRETFDRIRAHYPTVKVVFMSGYADDALDGIPPAPHWTFVQKPFDSATLIAAVQSVLTDQPAAGRDAVPA